MRLLTGLLVCISILLAACTPGETPAALTQTTTTGEDASNTATAATIDPYEFSGISQWFNIEGLGSTPGSLTKADLRGKVVLVDFWTYSCINCVRTLPYLTTWDERYRDDGLVIVGIHAPEFAFEKEPDNVAAALAKHSIKYPVGLDNDFKTWKVYKNSYWPHSYLFDRSGKLVFDHIGEGGYDEIEAKIQELLNESGPVYEQDSPSFLSISTPEIYLGGETTRGNIDYAGVFTGMGDKHTFTLPQTAVRNTVQLGGTWQVFSEYIEAVDASTVQLFYHAKDIHVVAAGAGTITVAVRGQPEQTITIDGDDLYTLASTDYKDQTVVLTVSPGVKLYSFTFG